MSDHKRESFDEANELLQLRNGAAWLLDAAHHKRRGAAFDASSIAECANADIERVGAFTAYLNRAGRTNDHAHTTLQRLLIALARAGGIARHHGLAQALDHLELPSTRREVEAILSALDAMGPPTTAAATVGPLSIGDIAAVLGCESKCRGVDSAMDRVGIKYTASGQGGGKRYHLHAATIPGHLRDRLTRASEPERRPR